MPGGAARKPLLASPRAARGTWGVGWQPGRAERRWTRLDSATEDRKPRPGWDGAAPRAKPLPCTDRGKMETQGTRAKARGQHLVRSCKEPNPTRAPEDLMGSPLHPEAVRREGGEGGNNIGGCHVRHTSREPSEPRPGQRLSLGQNPSTLASAQHGAMPQDRPAAIA